MSTDSSTEYHADELGQYQAISPSAVFSLILGLLSPLALMWPVLLLLPLFAIVWAWVAKSKINSSGGSITGTTIAHLGIALALVFGIAACSRIAVLNMLISRHIQEHPVATSSEESVSE